MITILIDCDHVLSISNERAYNFAISERTWNQFETNVLEYVNRDRVWRSRMHIKWFSLADHAAGQSLKE